MYRQVMEVLRMRIAEVAVRTGLTIDTLRFYEKESLVHPQRVNGQRHYTNDDVERLQIISQLRALDVSIPDIRILLSLDDRIGGIDRLTASSSDLVAETDAVLASLLSSLETRLAQMQAHVERLRAMRQKVAWLMEHGGLDHDRSMDVPGCSNDL